MELKIDKGRDHCIRIISERLRDRQEEKKNQDERNMSQFGHSSVLAALQDIEHNTNAEKTNSSVFVCSLQCTIEGG